MTSEQEEQTAALMARGQQGDAAAYADLLTLAASIARRYVRNRVGDVPWVDDVVQEALLSIHSARRTYDPRRPFGPWFYAIVSSRLIDVIRRERRVSSRERGADELPEPPVPAVRSASAGGLDLDRVKQALDALPTRQRAVVRALKFDDASVREVGERLNMSDSAVKVTAHRGYRALRRLLKGPQP